MNTPTKGIIKDYRYIYNMQQANFYIYNKVELARVEWDKYKNRMIFVFKDSKYLQEVFNKWMDREH